MDESMLVARIERLESMVKYLYAHIEALGEAVCTQPGNDAIRERCIRLRSEKEQQAAEHMDSFRIK